MRKYVPVFGLPFIILSFRNVQRRSYCSRTLLVAGTGFELSCPFIKYKMPFILTTNIYFIVSHSLKPQQVIRSINLCENGTFRTKGRKWEFLRARERVSCPTRGLIKPSRALQNSFGRYANTIFHNGNETS